MEKILLSILEEFKELNLRLSGIENQLEEIKGTGLYNSITDVCDKLDEVHNIKGDRGFDLTDIYSILNDIDSNTRNL